MPATDGLAQIDFDTGYRTGENDPVNFFYRPALHYSVRYKRAVGYFRSTVYILVGREIVEFAKRGGKISLICSPSLSQEDIASMQEGYQERELTLEKVIAWDLDQLLADEATKNRTRILATLIKVGSLDVRLALRPGAKGIYHEKIGVLRDNFGHRLSFLGSANETWHGWHELGNHEAVEVFCDWKQSEAERVARHEGYFDRLWEGKVAGTTVYPLPDAIRRRLVTCSLATLDETDELVIDDNTTARLPQTHQLAAITSWEAAGFRGILQHATGSGKTLTALIATRKHVSKGLPAIILVPSKLLLEQWAREVRGEIPTATILLVGGSHRT